MNPGEAAGRHATRPTSRRFSAAPNWDRQAARHAHNDLALTMKEAVESLHSNDTGDISNLDAILNLATMMADTLANGIIKQVPSRFV